MARLISNTYGKSKVRLTRVVRNGPLHSVFEMDVQILLEGAFEKVYTEGDNSACVPTDTMKNTVYALAKKHMFDSPEQFGMILTDHFVTQFQQVSAASATIEQTIWERISLNGKPHDHAFVKGSGAKRTAVIRRERPEGFLLQGGIKNLEVMKTTHSGFVGFLKDQYTTLKETTDRIFGTSVEANWIMEPADADFNAVFTTARQTILDVFATHDSLGVQHTIFEMGKQVLAAVPAIVQISFTMPNQHRILADLEPFGMTNPSEIFVNTSEPFGLIEGTILRETP